MPYTSLGRLRLKNENPLRSSTYKAKEVFSVGLAVALSRLRRISPSRAKVDGERNL